MRRRPVERDEEQFSFPAWIYRLLLGRREATWESMEQCEQRLLFSTVSGSVFADSNGDGFGTNERGMPDWVVFVDVDNDSAFDLSEPYAVTAIDGSYSIDAGSAAGTIRAVVPDGWRLTSPSSNPELDDESMTADFGLETTRPLAVTGFETLLNGRDARLTLAAAINSVRAWHVNWGDDEGVRTYGVASNTYITTVVHHYADGPDLYPVWVEATLADGNTVSVWTPDPEFGGDVDGVRTFDYGSGDNDAFEDVVVQPDGKIVAVGWAQIGGSSQTKRDFVVARFNTDGSYDTSFNSGGATPGLIITDFSTRFDRAIQVELLGDGSILVGGHSNLTNGHRVVGVAKYTDEGELDTSFGAGGKLQHALGTSDTTILLRSMAVDSEGRILLVAADSTHLRIGRFEDDGTLDTSFGTSGLVAYDMPDLFNTAELILAAGGEEYVEEASYTVIPVSIDGSGNVGAVTGYDIVMYDEETFEGNFLLRLTEDGDRDENFATEGLAQITLPFVVSDVRPLPDGGMVLGGHKPLSSTQSDFAVAKFTDAGILDTSFGPLGTGISTVDIDSRRDISVRMDLDANGRMTLVGTTGPQSGMHSFSAVRFTADGLVDTTFGNVGVLSAFVADDFARSAGFAFDPSGSFVIVGQCDEENSDTGLDAVILRMVDDGVSQRVFEPTITVSQPSLSADPLEVRYELELDGDSTIGRWLIDWGDGEVEEVVESDSLDLTHEYAALGEYTVRITGLTKAGPLSIDTRTITVAPDGPWAGRGSLTAAADAYFESLFSLVRRDTQIGDWTEIEIDWGDGLIETFDDESDEVEAVNANGAVPLRHAYTSPGDFTVTVTVTDGTDSFEFEHDWRIGVAWAPPQSAAPGIFHAPDDPDETANLTVSWDYRGIGTIFDAFDDEIGYFIVQDAQGGVVSGMETLYPGDEGYQDAALDSSNSAVLFASGLDPRDDDDDDDDGTLDGRIVASLNVPSNTYLGFYVIQGATTSEWRSRGTGMIPNYNAWFSVQGANADGFVHFQSPNSFEPFYLPDTFQLWAETASPFIENIGSDDLPWLPRDTQFESIVWDDYNWWEPPIPGDDDPSDPIDPDDGSGGGSGLRFDDILITIEVDDFEPEAPAIIGSATIPENIESGLVGVLTADDPNHDQSIAFSIDDDPSGWFEVVGNELRVKPGAVPDHESFDEVTLTIRATDSHADALYSTDEIVVIITDVDEAPEVDPEDLEATLAENSANTTVVTTLTAIDPDEGAFASTPEFEIVAGNDLGAFSIDSSGIVTVIDSTKINYEATPSMMLVVEISSDGDPDVVRRVPVHITLINVAENPEVDDAEFDVEERALVGTVVGTVSTLHLDSGETVTYSIQARDDDDVFELDASTGEVRVLDPEGLDFDAGPTEYEWTVRATDSSSATTDFTVTFAVLAMNEAPVIEGDAFSVAENSTAGTVIGSIDAIDPDDGQEITFQIVSGNGNIHGTGIFALERIDADTARIVVADPSKLDHEVQGSYSLVIEAFDDGAFVKRSTASFTITVTDVNEAPVLYAPDLFVGTSTSTSTVVGRIQAFDPDGDIGTTSWSITGSSGPFSINSSTGEIILVSSPGSPGGSHAITVQATESDPPFGSPPPAVFELTIEVQSGTEYGDLNVVLNEDGQRLTLHRYEFVLPAGIEAIALGMDDPDFDDGPESWMRDAVEFALLDSSGRPSSPTIAGSRDAFLNLTSGMSSLAAARSGLVTGTFGDFAKAAVVDVQHLLPGTRLVLEARLLNNELDEESTDTTITLASVIEFLTSSPVENSGMGEVDPSPTPSGLESIPSHLVDVSSGFEGTFGRTGWHGGNDVLSVDLALQSNGWFDGERAIRGDVGPMLLVISNINIPGVTLLGADGTTAAGDAYYDISAFAFAHGPIEDEDIISGLRLAFDFTHAVDPDNTPMSFEYRLLASINRAPFIESEPATLIDIDDGDGFVYDIVAEDADDDPITLTLLHGPTGMVFDSETPTRLIWSSANIASAGVGSYIVTLQASDPSGAKRAPQSFVLWVEDLANYAPVITSDPITRAFASSQYQYQIAAQDRNGRAGLVYSGSATYVDGGITHTIDENEFEVDSETGLVTWTPPVSFAGREVQVYLRVEDPEGAPDAQQFTLRVLMEPGNRVPVIYSTGASTANPTTVAPPHAYEFSFQMGVVDPDGDDLDYTVESDTLTGIAISETGLLTWSGDDTSAGQHTLHIEVTDGRGGIVTQEFVLTVSAPGPYGTATGIVFNDTGLAGDQGARTDRDLLLTFFQDVSYSVSLGYGLGGLPRLAPAHLTSALQDALIEALASVWTGDVLRVMTMNFAGAASPEPGPFGANAADAYSVNRLGSFIEPDAPSWAGGWEVPQYATDLESPWGSDKLDALSLTSAQEDYWSDWWQFALGWNTATSAAPDTTNWYSFFMTDGHHNLEPFDIDYPGYVFEDINTFVKVPGALGDDPDDFDVTTFQDAYRESENPHTAAIWIDKNDFDHYGHHLDPEIGELIDRLVADQVRRIIGEPGLGGWTVFADDNGNGVMDSWEWSTITDGSGRYTLDLPAGTVHTLRVVQQAGWTQRFPDGFVRRIVVGDGQTVEAGDFGVWQQGDVEEFEGEVFEDRNDNSIRDNELINDSADRLVFVFDVSASTIEQPDGWVQTPHDYQIEALQSLTSTYVNAGLGHVPVAVLAFTGLDPIHEAGPVTAWIDFDLNWRDEASRLVTVPIGQDSDGDGVSDVIQTLGAMRYAVADAQRYEPLSHWHNDYLSALLEVEDYVVGFGDANATTHVVFLSDADTSLVPYHDVEGDSIDAAVDRLRSEHGVSFEAVGFATAQEDAALWRIDSSTHWVSDPEDYVLYFSGQGGEQVEPASEGWSVFLDFNNNGVRDGSEPEDVTDGAGAFSFDGLTPGTYTVRVTPRAGYRFTSPASGVLSIDTAHVATGGSIRVGVNTFTANRNPIFVQGLPNPTGDHALIADHAWTADIAARDLDLADRDYLTFEIASAPDGMVIHPQSGRISWTPTSEDVGSHRVVVRVTDLHGGVIAQPITVEVVHNRAPEFTSSPPAVYLPTTETLTYQLEAVDLDGDDTNAFTYEVVGTKLGEPTPGLSISSTGEIVFDPPSNGVYEITAIVKDEFGAANWQTFAIAVASSEDADAVFTSSYRTTVRAGDTYRYRPVAIDPDGEELVIESALSSDPEANPRFADGWLTWTPSASEEESDFTFTIEGQETAQVFTVEVLPALRNAVPVIESQYVPRAELGALLMVDLVASDADDDSLVWRIEDGPSTLRLNADTGRLSWVPSPQDVGEHLVVIAVSDGYGGVDRITLDLSVFESRQAPRFAGSQSVQAYAGIGFDFGLDVVDPDGAGGPLEYYIVDNPRSDDDDAPAWLTIDRSTGVLSTLSPTVHPMGASHPYLVTVAVFDGDGLFDQTTVEIHVAPHAPPMFNDAHRFLIPAIEGTSFGGMSLQIADLDTDPEDLDVAIESTGGITGLSVMLNGDDWELHWDTTTPALTDHGREVVVSVTDEDDLSATATFRVYMTASTSLPPGLQIDLTPWNGAFEVESGLARAFDIRSSVVDDDAEPYWRFELLESASMDPVPTGLTIDANTGELSWDGDEIDSGEYDFRIRVTDIWGSADTEDVVLHVSQPDTTAPDTPSAVLTWNSGAAVWPEVPTVENRLILTPGSRLRLTLSGQDDTGIDYFVYRLATSNNSFDTRWVRTRNAVPELNLDSGANGLGTVKVLAVDRAGNVSEVFEHDINAVQNDAAPAMQIGGGLGDGGEITGFTLVPVTVSDPNSGDAVSIVARMTPIVDPYDADRPGQPIGAPVEILNRAAQQAGFEFQLAIDPNQFAQGWYELIVEATDTFGNFSQQQFFLPLRPAPASAGNSSLPFTDLSIASAGLPLTVTRTFDSKKATVVGDFGVGWNSNLGEMQVMVGNTDPVSRAFIDGTTIRVIMPDGRNLAFEFSGGGDDLYRYPSYTQVEDLTVFATLRVEGEDAVALSGSGDTGYFTDLGLPYNPFLDRNARFVLGFSDGTESVIRASTSELIEIRSRTGERLTYGTDADARQTMSSWAPDGSFLAGLAIERDDAGRIASIVRIDDAGEDLGSPLMYHYDDAGRLKSYTNRLGLVTTYIYGNEENPIEGDPATDPQAWRDSHPNWLWQVITERDVPDVVDPVPVRALALDYAADGRISRIEDPTGYGANLVGFEADNVPIGDSVTGDGQLPVEVYYDALGNIVRQVQHLGGEDVDARYLVTVFEYDLSQINQWGSSRQTGKSLPFLVEGVSSKLSWVPSQIPWESRTGYHDFGGAVAWTEDAYGNRTHYDDYDRFGNPGQVIDPLGNITRRIYDRDGRLIETIEPASEPGKPGRTTRNIFSDETGLLERTVELDDEGNEVTTSRFGYDQYRRRIWTENIDGIRQYTGYDDEGRQDISWNLRPDTSDPDELNPPEWLFVSTSEFDVDGRVIASRQFVIDADGVDIENIEEIRDAVALAAPESESTTEYNSLGQVVLTTDRYGATTESLYDRRGNVIQTVQHVRDTSTDEDYSLITRTAYDAQGRAFARTDAYLATLEMDEWVPADAESIRVTHTLFDTLGRTLETRVLIGLTESEHPIEIGADAVYDGLSAASFTLEYDSEEGWEEDSLLSREHSTYDDLGRVTRQASGWFTLDDDEPVEGSLVTFTYSEYDAAGRQTATVQTWDADLSNTIDAPDATGNGIPDTGAEFTRTSSEFDALGRAHISFDPLGLRSKSVYDGAGRATQSIHAYGLPGLESSISTSYDRRGRKLHEYDQLGQVTSYGYDDAGRLISVALPSLADPTNPEASGRATYRYAYDAFGNRTDIWDPTQADIDSHTTFSFDHRGRQRSRTLPMGQTDWTIYDDQTLDEVDADPEERGLSTALGQVAFRIDLDGNIAAHRYDNTPTGAGRLVETRYFHRDSVTAISISAATTASGLASALGSLTPEETVTYTHDAYGRVIETTQDFATGDDRTTTNTYDVQGRLTSIATTFGSFQSTVNYAYDLLGRVTRLWTGTNSASPNSDTTYTYDAQGRLRSVQATARFGAAALSSGSNPEAATTYTYDRRGGLDTIVMPSGIISDYEYDAAGRLTSLTHYAPRDAGDDEDTGPFTDNEILGQYIYLLREDGRRIGAIEKHDAGTSPDNSDLITTRWAWSYDSTGRLTQEAYDSSATGADYVHTYAFDDAGNRESWLKDTDPAFGSTGTGFLTFDVQSFAEEVTVTYDYDANDRLLTETLDAPGSGDDRHTVSDWDGGSTMQLGKVVYDTLDDTGDVVREESFSYTARGRLAGAEIDADGAGSSSAAETTTTYTYDDHGFRVRQVVARAGQATSVTEFVADANNPTGYTQTIEEHSREGTTPTRQVSYTIGLDEIVQAVKDNPTASAVVSQFLHDGRGSVRQLADALAELARAATKDLADVLKLDYSAYGTAVNYAAETVATALLHNGEFVDPVTGQQYLRARWYDQVTGRFPAFDPALRASFRAGMSFAYSFAASDPLLFTDPLGTNPFLLLPLVGGFVGLIDGALNGHTGEELAWDFFRGAASGLVASALWPLLTSPLGIGITAGAGALLGGAGVTAALDDDNIPLALFRGSLTVASFAMLRANTAVEEAATIHNTDTRWVLPINVRFSQRTTGNPFRTRAWYYNMKSRWFAWDERDAPMAIRMADGELTMIDHTRVSVWSHIHGPLRAMPMKIVKHSEVIDDNMRISRGFPDDVITWGDAVRLRASNNRLPPEGVWKPPKLNGLE